MSGLDELKRYAESQAATQNNYGIAELIMEAVKDAQRYRWLKQNADIILDREAGYISSGCGNMIYTKQPAQDEIDRAIDSAMCSPENPS